MAADGVAMLHVDTEGFEAAGRSDACRATGSPPPA